LRRFEKTGQRADLSGTPEDLHRLRIESKRLRYAMELAVDLLPGLTPPLKDLARMQSTLGRLHDIDITVGVLGSAHLSPSTRAYGLAHLARKRHRLMVQWRSQFDPSARRALAGRVSYALAHT
jgi:CHAD domain-containing protein